MMRARNRHCPTWLLLAAVLACALPAARPAHAAAYTYSTRQRTINAGILLVDDANSGMNDGLNATNGLNMGANDPDPYVFYVLNQRTDIKPIGWNIVNPLAPPTVTSSIQTRWDARAGVAVGSHAYTLHQRITSDMAAYWEVSLSQTGLDDLLQYDILLLNLQGHTVQLTMTETEKLRRFVDGGGQLWVEDSGGGNLYDVSTASPYGPLFFDLQFNNAAPAGQAIPPQAIGTQTLLGHPIIDTPNQLSNKELNGLNRLSAVSESYSLSAPDPTLLTTVVANGSDNLPIIAAGQLGAGQVVVTTTASSAAINNAVGGTNGGWGANSGPFTGTNFSAAPVADLKLVSNILSWDTAHPTEHKTSHQSSESRSSLGPAVTPVWNFPVTFAGGLAPGAAVNGDYVYVRTTDGVTRAFNAEPGTDILGLGTPDAGILDYTKGFPYDEIWDTVNGGGSLSAAVTAVPSGPYVSAPTVASIPNGRALVFVEDINGVVYAADSLTGAPYGGGTGKLPNSGVPTGGTATYAPTTGPAPAPTFYGGRLYAGQPDGFLYVYDFNPGSAKNGLRIQVDAGGEPVIAPPAVGIVRDSVNGPAGVVQVDDIVAAVSTTLAVYTVQLGARRDVLLLQGGGYAPVAASSSGSPFLVDPASPGKSYYDGGFGYPVVATAAAANPFFLVPPVATVSTYYADYDVDFSQAAASNTILGRAAFSANSGSSTVTPPLSAPALASNGYFYYTANVSTTQGLDSTLVCAHDSRQAFSPQATNRMLWRFRMPFSGEGVVDADGVSYNPLQGYQFAGAPVVDSQGNVFALAVSAGGQAAILDFNGTQEVSVLAVPAGQAPPNTVTVSAMTQPLLGLNSAQDEFGGSPAAIINGQQYNGSPDGNGDVSFFNFGTALATTTVTPNLAEPEPVSVVYSSTTSNGTVTLTNPDALLHTNMAWYTSLTTKAPVNNTAGLALVGKYLFFGDSAGYVYRFYAYPQDAGLIGANRAVSPAAKDNEGRPVYTFVPTTAGSISGTPSAGNNVLVVNGAAGVVALGSRYTLVADSDRVLEVDGDGIASWAVDATRQPTVDATGQIVPTGPVTHLDLNRPGEIYQEAANDYLVADTGNNRCVRFDRAGNVTWELTRFNDYPAAVFGKAASLLTPGEPTTLNHPASVQSEKPVYFPDTVNGGLGTIIHYLISDTGNYRILDVVDAFDSLGKPIGPQHNLVWLSHTYDVQHRRYRYASASYFTGPPDASGNVKHYVAALITNARLKTPLPATPGQLNAAASDAPGSSLVLLDYDPVSTVGLVAASASSYYIYLQPGGQFDVNTAPKLTTTLDAFGNPTRQPEPATQPTQVYLRNPRFLQAYTPPGGAGVLQDFLLADDNGVFDLFLNTGVLPHRFEAQWGCTQVDYQALLTPGIFPATRANIRFSPNSLQRTGTELVSDTAGNYLMGHYIVANGYSQGEVNPVAGFGGEALELYDTGGSTLTTQIYASFSKPAGTSPLSQPAFAIREK